MRQSTPKNGTYVNSVKADENGKAIIDIPRHDERNLHYLIEAVASDKAHPQLSVVNVPRAEGHYIPLYEQANHSTSDVYREPGENRFRGKNGEKERARYEAAEQEFVNIINNLNLPPYDKATNTIYLINELRIPVSQRLVLPQRESDRVSEFNNNMTQTDEDILFFQLDNPLGIFHINPDSEVPYISENYNIDARANGTVILDKIVIMERPTLLKKALHRYT